MMKVSMKMPSFLFFLIFFTLSGVEGFFLVPKTHANRLDTPYQIENQDVRIIEYRIPPTQADKRSKSNQNNTTIKTLRQGDNFVVTTTTPKSFSFQLTNTQIDFNVPSATVPIIRTSSITISSPTPYFIFGSQDHQLKADSLILPNTTCDNGSCSETIASLWDSNLTYGAGFRCDSAKGVMCPKDFEKQSYRHFADRSYKQKDQIIMQGSAGSNQQGIITYKIVTSQIQQTGAYHNTIRYIAIPNF